MPTTVSSARTTGASATKRRETVPASVAESESPTKRYSTASATVSRTPTRGAGGEAGPEDQPVDEEVDADRHREPDRQARAPGRLAPVLEVLAGRPEPEHHRDPRREAGDRDQRRALEHAGQQLDRGGGEDDPGREVLEAARQPLPRGADRGDRAGERGGHHGHEREQQGGDPCPGG